MKNLNQLIKINDDNCEIIKPDILLEKRNGDVIGKLNYSNLHMSISGTDCDEITFDIYKAVEPLFDSVIDLKICHVVGYGRFEIAITKTCEETELKSVTGISLETELAQSYLYEVHVNDEEYMERVAEKEIYIDDFDENENLIPIVFYNAVDPRHSLLHLLLSDKGSHWSYGYITPFITEDILGAKKEIAADKFQRTFTFDGTDIMSAMSEISKECNVIFYFNTEQRTIDVYNRFTLGEDTTVLINRRNLASSIQINDLKDEVKNCFRVSGGDDVITNYFSAVNITGNYIYDLSYQEEDMPEGLANAIHNYLDYKDTLNDEYYGGYDVYDLLTEPNVPVYKGEVSALPSASSHLGDYYYLTTDGKYYISNGTTWEIAGAFVRYCSAVDWQNHYEHTMAPIVGLTETTATEQANKIISELQTITADYKGVAVSNLNISSSDFASATNNVLAYIKVILDSRYTVKNIEDIANNYPRYNGSTKKWYGKLEVYRTSDETDNKTFTITVPIINDNTDTSKLEFAKQKIYKSLASNSTYEVDQYIVQITQGLDVDSAEFKRRIKNYMSLYNLTELKTYYDAFQSCVNVLDTYYTNGTASQSALFETIYKSYKCRADVTLSVYEERKRQVDNYADMVEKYSEEIANIQKQADFKTYLDNIDVSYWSLFNSYRREDSYQNDNYISDGLNDGQILAKCKELLNAAQYNLSIACRLQHSLDVAISNLLIMPEFKAFWDMFSIYNYIRVQEDDLIEPYKLQLIQADLDFDNPEDINVTFATNLAGNGNVLYELESVVAQSVSIGTSFSSVTQQSSRGNDAKSYVNSWLDNGLNMAATQVKNADNEEVTVNNYGILCRSEADDGEYDPFQVKITGQGMFYTGDNWDHVLGCLGRIWVDDHWDSGLIANAVIGNLIAGQSLKITNSSGSFVLDGNKATFTDISINYQEGTGSSKKYVKIGNGQNIFRIGVGSTDQLYFDTTTNTMTLTGNIKASTITGSTFKNTSGTFSIDYNGNINGATITGSTFKNSSNTFSIDSSGNIKGATITGSSLTSVSGKFKTVIDSGAMNIYYDDKNVAMFGSTSWKDTSMRGASISCPSDSKFITFNTTGSSTTWSSALLINNGLDPYNIKEEIIAFEGMCVSKLTFTSNNYYDPDKWFIDPVTYDNYWEGLHIDPGAYCIIGDYNTVSTYSNKEPVALTVHGDIAMHLPFESNYEWLVPSWGDFRFGQVEFDGLPVNYYKYQSWTFDTEMLGIPYVVATVNVGIPTGITVSSTNASSTSITIQVASDSTHSITGKFYVTFMAVVPRHF